MRLSTTPVTAAQARSRDRSNNQKTPLKSALLDFPTQPNIHLLVHSSCDLLIGYGHVLRGWSEHTLHEGALPLQVVVHWGGHSQVSKAAEVCIGTVQQVVQTLAALQSCNPTSGVANTQGLDSLTHSCLMGGCTGKKCGQEEGDQDF